MRMTSLFLLAGFPHSDIHGSINICFSPWLFAAYHVLLRLLVPRHSPYALCSLTFLLRINFVLLCQASVIFRRRTIVLSSQNYLPFLVILVSTMQNFWHNQLNYVIFYGLNNHISVLILGLIVFILLSKYASFTFQFFRIYLYIFQCAVLDYF